MSILKNGKTVSEIYVGAPPAYGTKVKLSATDDTTVTDAITQLQNNPGNTPDNIVLVGDTVADNLETLPNNADLLDGHPVEYFGTADDITQVNNSLDDISNKMNNPNLLINGGFDIWQRGTDFNFFGGIGYSADMWYNLHQHIKYTRVANTSPICCDYALRVTNANDGSIDGGGWGTVLQKIEKNYVGKILTLSTYVRSINGSFEFSMGDWNGNVLKKTISDEWEYLKHVFVMGNSNIVTLGSQLRLADTTKGYEITGVKLELGDIATSFAPVNYGEELAKCQRYLAELNSYKTSYVQIGSGIAINTTTAIVQVPLPTTLRIAPTLSYSGNWKLLHQTAAVSVTGMEVITRSGANQINITVTTKGGLVAGQVYELMSDNDNTASLLLSAEL